MTARHSAVLSGQDAAARSEAAPRRSLVALDWLNFLMADVQNGLGPYLATFLRSACHWGAGDIGMVMAIGNLAGALAQVPAGLLVDGWRDKRRLIALAVLATAAGCGVIAWRPALPWVAAAQAILGATAALLPPALAALCLGLVGHHRLPARLGRVQAFNHAGAFVTALLVAFGSRGGGYDGVFLLFGLFAAGMMVAVFSIRAGDVDPSAARGGGPAGAVGRPADIGRLLSRPGFRMFLGLVLLFHFGNAAMLPMAGQVLALAHPGSETVALSACILVAQPVMAVIALAVGRRLKAGRGRKAVLLTMFAMLPVRGVLLALFAANPWAVVIIQLLDGIAAGIFSVISVIICDDLTLGTGRFNLAQGMVALAVGIGAGLSNLTAGFVVQRLGYSDGFFYLALIAAGGLAVCALFMPETDRADADL